MLKNIKVSEKLEVVHKKPIIITFIGSILTVFLIVITLEIINRNLNAFISTQQKYILSIESAILVTFVVELLVRLSTLRLRTPQMLEYAARLRFFVRVIGYCVGLLSVVSILASNATLGISVGAIAGALIVFSTQSLVSSVLATVVILSTRMIRVGEEITVNQTKGTVADINLTHTLISIDDDVVFVPNSLIISSLVRRKKRNPDKDAGINEW
jgi:small-conductance mechanosensitive channel